jgi:hypothetical protein
MATVKFQKPRFKAGFCLSATCPSDSTQNQMNTTLLAAMIGYLLFVLGVNIHLG